MAPISCADFSLPVTPLDEGDSARCLHRESDVGSPRSEIENDSEDRLRIPQVTFVGSAYTAHMYLLRSLAMLFSAEAHYGSAVTCGEAGF